MDVRQLQAWFLESRQGRVEGIVWHCGDGTLLKVKNSHLRTAVVLLVLGDPSQNRSVTLSAGPLPPPGPQVARRDAQPQRQAAGGPRGPDGSVHRRRRQGFVHPPVQAERTAVPATAGRPFGLGSSRLCVKKLLQSKRLPRSSCLTAAQVEGL